MGNCGSPIAIVSVIMLYTLSLLASHNLFIFTNKDDTPRYLIAFKCVFKFTFIND